jgi:hypothetical protein
LISEVGPSFTVSGPVLPETKVPRNDLQCCLSVSITFSVRWLFLMLEDI